MKVIFMLAAVGLAMPFSYEQELKIYEEGVTRCKESCKADAQMCLGNDTPSADKLIACFNDKTFTISAECSACIDSSAEQTLLEDRPLLEEQTAQDSAITYEQELKIYEEGVTRCEEACKDDAQRCLGDDTPSADKLIACYNEKTFTISAACSACIDSSAEQSLLETSGMAQSTVANSTPVIVPVLAVMLAVATFLLICLGLMIRKETQLAFASKSYNDKLHLVDDGGATAGPASPAYDTTAVTLNP